MCVTEDQILNFLIALEELKNKYEKDSDDGYWPEVEWKEVKNGVHLEIGWGSYEESVNYHYDICIESPIRVLERNFGNSVYNGEYDNQIVEYTYDNLEFFVIHLKEQHGI